MVDIIVGSVPPIHNNPKDRQGQRRQPPEKKRPLKERRKNRVDRREEARFGVVVTLCNKEDRRAGPDRRRDKSTEQIYYPVET